MFFFLLVVIFIIPCFAETADREQASEAEDRHVRESECMNVCNRCTVTRKTNQALLINHTLTHPAVNTLCISPKRACLSLDVLLVVACLYDKLLMTCMGNVLMSIVRNIPGFQVVMVTASVASVL